MKQTNIEWIDLKLQQLKNQRTQLLAKQCVAERKRTTRQAIILGKWLMAKQQKLVTAIAGELERDQDRAVFGLPPKAKKTTAVSSVTQVDILLPLDNTVTPSSMGELRQA